MKSKLIKRTLLAGLYGAFTIIVFLCCLPGCQVTPEPGGPYEGRQFLLQMDLSTQRAFSVIDAFMTWEYKNHAELLTNAPQVFAASEIIRTNAPLWTQVIKITRSNYVYALEQSQDATAPSNQLKAAVSSLTGQATLTQALKP